MRQSLDLFGQVAVTWPDVAVWLENVAGLAADSPRALAYVRGWDVPGKVAAAKLAGDWPPKKSPGRQAGGNPWMCEL